MDTPKKKDLISVVFSFRNEEKNLEELIRRVRDVFSKIAVDYELIFVNDYSDDNSLYILLGYAKEDSRIKIVNMSRRWGNYPCIVAGFRYTKGDAVIYMDTDLQDPPELIPEMIEKWKRGVDIVNTVRTKRLGENPFKMFLTKIAYKIINLFADFDIPENAGEFKLLSRQIVDTINTFDDRVHFLRGITQWVGFKKDTVYYVRQARFSGKSHYPIFCLRPGPIRTFVDGIVSFSSIPLYFSFILGFIVSFISFCCLIYIVVNMVYRTEVSGWMLTNAIMLALFGILFVMVGILGLYIEKIFTHTRKRPLYIVKDFISFNKG